MLQTIHEYFWKSESPFISESSNKLNLQYVQSRWVESHFSFDVVKVFNGRLFYLDATNMKSRPEKALCSRLDVNLFSAH